MVAIALELANQPPLRPAVLVRDDDVVAGRVFEVPALTGTWAKAAADLVDPVTGEALPISFDDQVAGEADDVVLAHLGHRLVAQSMRLLRSEIWSSGSAIRLSRVTARVANVTEVGVQPMGAWWSPVARAIASTRRSSPPGDGSPAAASPAGT